jgi:hypothetical protein
MAPRTAIQVMGEQQELIRVQARRVEAQDLSIGNMVKIASAQEDKIDRLIRGLQALSQMAGVEAHVARAMGLMHVQADVQNPAEPVPEPPAVAPTESTVETKTPEAKADVLKPGLVPGSTSDVAADATTTNYTPGGDIPSPAFKNLQDVTAPIEGTQTQRPLNETKTETDVRVGDPMNPQTAFPLQGGFANAQRTSSRKTAQQIAEDASLRTMAALRLARLRIQVGTETEGDLAVQARIEKNAALSIDAIESEISTLDGVIKRQAARGTERNARLVPKSASGRQAPPMAGAGQRMASSNPLGSEDDLLFL